MSGSEAEEREREKSADREKKSKSAPKHKRKKKKKKKSRSKDESASDSESSSESESDSSSSESDSDSDSDSDSGSSSEEDRKKSKRKKKGKSKSKSKSKSKKKKSGKSRKKDKKRKDKKKKKKKKKKKDLGYGISGVITANQWGKYGVVREEDRMSKGPEYYAWLMEVKHIDRSCLNQREEKEYFKEYAEDYNTATFKDPKYYDLAKWQSEQGDKGADDLMNDQSLTDEDKLRLQRQNNRAARSNQAENARIQAVLQNLRVAKASGSAQWDRVEKRSLDDLKKPTFESIAKDRKKRKHAAEEAYKGGQY